MLKDLSTQYSKELSIQNYSSLCVAVDKSSLIDIFHYFNHPLYILILPLCRRIFLVNGWGTRPLQKGLCYLFVEVLDNSESPMRFRWSESKTHVDSPHSKRSVMTSYGDSCSLIDLAHFRNKRPREQYERLSDTD